VSIAAAGGILELNVYQPLVAGVMVESCGILASVMESFTVKCVDGIKANEKKIKEYLDSSLMLVTALSPAIGYEKAAAIARRAHEKDISLREAAKEMGISEAEFDSYVKPEEMV